ncbi:MBL fold metallo-hydrolase [Flavobacterium reichenbachii]|uniref:Beta-lactamase n=1 Tax=Flavobacterium reichenbachii TaxID=362418 RepID=A0A085ZIN7_9FLAO|nr:MBL fold metallo-hydrolase [Flavobacterium reichenbachii]KFF04301.1 beta-lactamase [Flavobacterium reichenbachii]OXB11706.1 MBL fold metallo-hydrolase [Flavobacterium reichenbachii]
MRIIALKEGDFLVNKNKEFVLLNEADNVEGLRMAIQPFLVVTNDDYILLDGGNGWKNEGKLVVEQLLNQENIQTSQITKVLLSHLHKDHIEGLFLNDTDLEQTFPNAAIYVQKREFDYALTQQGNPSFDFNTLERLQKLPNIHWMEEDHGEISPAISFEVTSGHTPFHQVFWIRENGETTFYGADNLPQRSYLKFHIAYKTDFDGKKAKELRQIWEQKAKEENWNILLYHDMKTSVLKLE